RRVETNNLLSRSKFRTSRGATFEDVLAFVHESRQDECSYECKSRDAERKIDEGRGNDSGESCNERNGSHACTHVLTCRKRAPASVKDDNKRDGAGKEPEYAALHEELKGVGVKVLRVQVSHLGR